jgi:hypothetical protein
LLSEQGVDLPDGPLQALDRAHAHPLVHVLTDSKADCTSIRVPSPRSASRTLTLLTGMSAIAVPSVSAKASVNSKQVGGLTAVTRQVPHDRSPSGPVMKNVISPPGVRSCFSTLARVLLCATSGSG